MGEWLYRYDAMNRLVEASDGAMTAKFYYDAKNRCVARRYQGTGLTPYSLNLTLNYYDNWNLIAEYDLRGAQIARYVHGRRIDEIIVMVNRHGVFYPHHDALGNVTMLTGADGKLVERYSYSVEGKVTISDATGETLSTSAVGNRWMFTGREWLQEVGLYDYRNRVYSAELGRFMQTDPIRFSAEDVNIYRYVFNRILSLVDPYGLVPAEVSVYLYTDGSGYAHTFTHGVYENGNNFTKGNYENGVQDDTNRLNDPNTTLLERHTNLTDQQVGQVQYYIGTQNGLYGYFNHCGDTADDARDSAGITKTVDASQRVEYETAKNFWSDFVNWLGNLFE